jgi:membrane protein YqaA with SNARE-associated domain
MPICIFGAIGQLAEAVNCIPFFRINSFLGSFCKKRKCASAQGVAGGCINYFLGSFCKKHFVSWDARRDESDEK